MRSLTLILSMICLMFAATAAKADRRVAFVVGNGSYKNVAQLPNPPIDAKAMAGVLRNVGFDVVEGVNLSRDKMTEKLLDFGKKAQGADVAVFFYAGHGIAISSTNYLLPVDADIKSEMDVKLGAAINIDLTLDQTMGDAKVKLVFLDACRDNPFAAKIKSNATRSVSVQQGLAEMKSGDGPRDRCRARVLALGQGLQQAGRAERLCDQLSQRSVQGARAGQDRLAGKWSLDRDPQPDRRH